MKLRASIYLSLLTALGLLITLQSPAVAGFGINIGGSRGSVRVDNDGDVRVRGGNGRVRVEADNEDRDRSSNSSSASDSNSSTAAANATGFSGDSSTYLDDYNGYKLSVPAEFSQQLEGQTSMWMGPILDGGAVGLSVNAAPLPGVSSAQLQQTYLQKYRSDRNYTDVVAMQVPYGDKLVPALRVKEVDNKPGSRNLKAADDIHRWHVIAFANERVYTMGFTGMFKTFQNGEVQPMFERVIDSVEMVAIAP